MAETIGVYEVQEETERLDRIAKALYGSEQGGTIEALLNANPGLAALGPLIPRGTRIGVPERPAPPEPSLTRPWD